MGCLSDLLMRAAVGTVRHCCPQGAGIATDSYGWKQPGGAAARVAGWGVIPVVPSPTECFRRGNVALLPAYFSVRRAKKCFPWRPSSSGWWLQMT